MDSPGAAQWPQLLHLTQQEVSVGLHTGTTPILISETTSRIVGQNSPSNYYKPILSKWNRGPRRQEPRTSARPAPSVGQTVRPLSLPSGGRQAEKPEHNYQVLLFPGSEEHSAPSPRNQSPAVVPFVHSKRSLFSIPQAHRTHTLRFVMRAFYSTQLPRIQREALFYLISCDPQVSLQAEAEIRRHLPAGHLRGLPPHSSLPAGCFLSQIMHASVTLTSHPTQVTGTAGSIRKSDYIWVEDGEKEKEDNNAYKTPNTPPATSTARISRPLLLTTVTCHHAFSHRWH